MSPELEQLAQRAVGALLNGLYQGLLLALVLWLGLRIFRGTNAATRHAVGFVVLLMVTLLPCLHFLLPGGVQLTLEITSSEQGLGQNVVPEPEVKLTAAPVTQQQEMPALIGGDSLVAEPRDPIPEAPFVEPAPFRELITADATKPPSGSALALTAHPEFEWEPEARFNQNLSGTLIRVPSDESSVATGAQGRFNPTPVRQWQAEVPGVVSVFALSVLCAIAGLRLLRLLWQWLVLLQLKRTATPPGSELADRFAALQHELQITRPVRLLVDDRITTPMAVGYFRPVVLLPAALAAGPVERGIEGILRHELAHIQRRDDWSNLLQQVIAAIHFYHPAVAWLSRRITIEREVACDDFALTKCASRRDYALLLAEFAGHNRGREWIAAPAAWSNRSQLKERINMILDPHRNTSRRLARTSAGALTVAALATAAVTLFAGPRLVLAASTEKLAPLPPADGPAVALVSPSGEELIAHVNDAPPAGASISVSSDVEWNLDHNASHAVAIARGPEVLISARPAIKVVPGTTITVPGPSGFIVAHGTPPEPAQPKEARPPKSPKPGRAPKALPAPATEQPLPPEKSGESIEQRMERLERMIEQLVGKERKFRFELQPGKEMELKGFEWQNVPPPGEPFAWNHPNPDQQWPLNKEQRKAVEESVKVTEKEVARAMKEVQREMARASEDAEKTGRDAELRSQLELKKEQGRTIKEAGQQRKALEGHRRSLEREMENLSRHLERLEQQIENLDEQMERLDEQEEEAGEPGESGEAADSQPRVKEKEDKP